MFTNPLLSAMMGIVPEQTATSVLHQCIPLYTLLAALGNPTVHWFILDIEGAELQVLRADLFMITAHPDTYTARCFRPSPGPGWT